MSQNLQNKFLALLSKLGAPEEVTSQAWQQLSELYGQEGRYYHTLNHIDHMLLQMEEHVPKEFQSRELELAIWYHDVIYEWDSKENERKSADLCLKVLTNNKLLATESIDLVEALIMSTKGHQIRLQGQHLLENQLMLDLDLSILGVDTTRYKQYSIDIRQEYIQIPLEDYQKGRVEVLTYFLNREELYFSPIFKRLYEKQARENLQREIDILKE